MIEEEYIRSGAARMRFKHGAFGFVRNVQKSSIHGFDGAPRVGVDGRRCRAVNLAHDALPGDHGALVHPTQLITGTNHQRSHEMLHVQLVGAAVAFAFLLSEPDVLFGNVGERGNRRRFSGRVNED